MAVQVENPKTGKIVLVCGAKKKDGSICMGRPMKTNGRCRLHGGKNLVGPQHPNWKTGKYSKILRRDVLTAYVDALALDDPYSMREEIALIDARLALLARGLNDNEGSGLLESIYDLQTTIVQSDNNGDVVDMRFVIDKINEMAEMVKNERRQWAEIYDVIDHRRKLVESERKREIDSQRMISEQQALVIISLLVNIIRKHVQDQAVLNTIAAELNGLTDWKTGLITQSQSG